MVQDTDQYITNGGQHGTSRSSGNGATVHEAAQVLGVTVDAIRKRIQRGTIPHERHENGRVYVLLDTARTLQDDGQDKYQTRRDDLVESLREQVEYLKAVVSTRDEEIRRRDHIIAGLVERLPPQLEAPQTAAEEPEGTDSPSTGAAPQQAPERRSWWRRLFG
jgi:excisionase family DNA binding protein